MDAHLLLVQKIDWHEDVKYYSCLERPEKAQKRSFPCSVGRPEMTL